MWGETLEKRPQRKDAGRIWGDDRAKAACGENYDCVRLAEIGG